MNDWAFRGIIRIYIIVGGSPFPVKGKENAGV